LGGLLDQQLLALDVRCKPGDLPEKLQGDITNLDVGEPFHVNEVTWPEGVRPVASGDVVVAIVAEVRALKAAAAAGGGEEEAAEATA
jgi:large subunit ribosomal protein L25